MREWLKRLRVSKSMSQQYVSILLKKAISGKLLPGRG